jgi:pullulanase/glycogen debranching enzyme
MTWCLIIANIMRPTVKRIGTAAMRIGVGIAVWKGRRAIQQLRRCASGRSRIFLLLLCSSQGIPIILAGDEIRHTQRGNNNAYCQDNEIGWFDWQRVEKNGELFRFFKMMLAFRKHHPNVHREHSDRILAIFEGSPARKPGGTWLSRMLSCP